MNISTLAKILGTSISDLREVGTKNSIYGFFGRNTRIPYNSAAAITKIVRPDKLAKLENDDRIYLPSNIIVADFAESIGRPVGQVIRTLVMNGIMVTMSEKIDYDTASLIASEFGVEVFAEDGGMFEDESGNSDQLVKTVEYENTDKKMVLRPPVITVMGHVDHGKTTLLDTIRSTNVVAGEAGAITQHISSYKIEYQPKDDGNANLNLLKGKSGGYKMTFVDTPGHEAFTAMRARGSQMADFVILMVSAIEGPKPQTVEVIERSKLSKVPVIVAINKTDLPEADPERVKQEIAKYGLVPEEWGGDTPFISISAKNNIGIDKLIETILVHAEIAEPKGEIDCPGQAVVVESHLDTKFGIITTALVVKDTIRVGDIIRSGDSVGKIRRLESTDGQVLQEAVIGDPVVIIGLSDLINVGEAIVTHPSVKDANNQANIEKIKKAQSKKIIMNGGTVTATDNQINIVIKADVFGSLEAIKESILKIPQEKVKIVIKSEGVGGLSESDVEFAETSGSSILAFHCEVSSKIEQMVKNKKINLVQSDIIYELLEWVEEEILKNTKHETKIIVLGKAKVLATFKAEKQNQQVFGAEVIDGKIFSNKELRLYRNREEIGKLDIVELQRNKVKASEVNISQQFGVSVTGKGKIQKDDEVWSVDEILVK